jgi:hypothetical protein
MEEEEEEEEDPGDEEEDIEEVDEFAPVDGAAGEVAEEVLPPAPTVGGVSLPLPDGVVKMLPLPVSKTAEEEKPASHK